MLLAASRRVLARFLVVTAVFAAVSCGRDDTGSAFVVGAGDSVESGVLAEIYAGALARTGLRVSVLSHLGRRADYLTALDDGRVELVGEHSGALLTHLDTTANARTPQQVTAALNRALPPGLVVADPAEWTDLRPRVVLPSEVAAGENVRSVAQLGPRCPAWRAAAAPVPDVLPAASPARVAGCDFAGIRPLPDPAVLRDALVAGEFQAGLLEGPPALAPGSDAGLTVLTDEDYALPAQNVVPLFRKGVLDERRVEKLNYVAGELTTDDLVDLILRVRAGASAAQVARLWLDAHAL
ncbi:glycine betaine ABC transporter substrate-binding protein [Nocardia arizonensis]|uniref:glycine betaine ABC transporter substrate-binding protein n=1 Tax=Nocardia arizonensis TaxID=1141647 RepID=UPI0006D259FD|nr:glycine betaine ABC transporter substrate-binding protein [Nocardia arizonensis]